MATESIIAAGGGDYTTIQGWADAHASTTLSAQQIGEIRDTAVYDEHVTFTAIVSTSTLNMVLSVRESDRGKGIAGSGPSLHPTDGGHAIDAAGADHFIAQHLEIHPGTSNSDECIRANEDNLTMQYCNCIGRGDDVSPTQQDGIHCTRGGSTVNSYNNFYTQLSRSGMLAIVPFTTTVTFNIKNCTAIHNGTTSQQNSGGFCSDVANSQDTLNFNVDNCLALGNLSNSGDFVNGDFNDRQNLGTRNHIGTGNIASDTTAKTLYGNTNNLDSATLTSDTTPGAGVWVVMVNITNSVEGEDCHLQSSSENEAENANSSISFADTTGTFTDDIDGDTRTAATMDGGGDQISSAAVGATSPGYIQSRGGWW